MYLLEHLRKLTTVCSRLVQFTHTHTHTYIYIYIYILQQAQVLLFPFCRIVLLSIMQHKEATALKHKYNLDSGSKVEMSRCQSSEMLRRIALYIVTDVSEKPSDSLFGIKYSEDCRTQHIVILHMFMLSVRSVSKHLPVHTASYYRSTESSLAHSSSLDSRFIQAIGNDVWN